MAPKKGDSAGKDKGRSMVPIPKRVTRSQTRRSCVKLSDSSSSKLAEKKRKRKSMEIRARKKFKKEEEEEEEKDKSFKDKENADKDMGSRHASGADVDLASSSVAVDTDADAHALSPPILRSNTEPVSSTVGTKGGKIPLLTNHLKVNVGNLEGHFYHYSVVFFYEDGRPVEQKGVGRKILGKVHETYLSDLDSKKFAYDGEKDLFTSGALPCNKMKFSVSLDGNESPSDDDDDDVKKCFRVEISYVAKIPLQALADAMCGQESKNSQEAIRVLNIILRQHASRQGCLVRRSSIHYDPSNCEPVGGVSVCRGFHSSFRTTQTGMSLTMDVTTTLIIKPGPVVDFIIANQNAKDPSSVDWSKAKTTLKNLRIKVSPSNQEYRITDLSDKPCREQTFEYRPRNGNGMSESVEMTVLEYFCKERGVELSDSANMPCINVGTPEKPIYFPLEYCTLIPLQRYTKSLNRLQKSELVMKSRQTPQEKMNALSKALTVSSYDTEPILSSCGISISSKFTQVEGRVLPAPTLKTGWGEVVFPKGGLWKFKYEEFVEPTTIGLKNWIIVNFNARCNVNELIYDLRRIGKEKGLEIADPSFLFCESHEHCLDPPLIRVKMMCDLIKDVLIHPPEFVLCLLPKRPNSGVYGQWKKNNLFEFGFVNQCLAPVCQPNGRHVTTLLMKINAKLGGLNSMLSVERTPAFTTVSKVPTIILGMAISRGFPSIAAVVSSRNWPSISRYRASVRTQPPRAGLIESLEGIIKELLVDFVTTSDNRKPEHIIIFRNGVGESQFNQVLKFELAQIIQACRLFDEKWKPKFLLIVAQKSRHTKFSQAESHKNVPPGTIVDNTICHPKKNDFYLCAHAGTSGTTRPTHYNVLYDDIGFSPDEVQELIHSLSYVSQRSTTATSLVAPICYARSAAAQIRKSIEFENQPRDQGSATVEPLPEINPKVANSMFFC